MQQQQPFFGLRELKVEVTYRCDLDCVHCSSDGRPSNSLEMARGECLRILNDAAEMGVREVAFSGGEPLLWPHILDAVGAAAQVRMIVTIYTSGNTDDFKQKAGQLHSLGATRSVFSVFGATTTSHERITRKAGSFERTKTAVGDAVTAGLTAELHFVPMSCNYRELRDVATLGRELGAARISVLRLVPQGRAVLLRDRALTRVQNLELRREIQSLREEYGSQFVRTGSPYNFLMLNDEPACRAAIDRLIVGPDMRLYPCDAFKRIDASEIVKTEDWSSLATASLPECWANSAYLRAVREHLAKDSASACKSCRFLGMCASGCLAQKVIAYGSLDGHPDPDCLAAHLKGDIS